MRIVDIRRLGCGTPKPYKHETGRACRTLAGLVTPMTNRVARTIPGLGLNPKPVTRCSDTPRAYPAPGDDVAGQSGVVFPTPIVLARLWRNRARS